MLSQAIKQDSTSVPKCNIYRKFDKRQKMITALQVDITFDQVLALVKQLPITEKIKLTKELEREGIETKLSGLLKTFRIKELSLETINEEVEIVRQQIYESKNHSSRSLTCSLSLLNF